MTGLLLAYCAILALLVLALLWSRWPAWMKGLLVVAATVLYFHGDELSHRVAGFPSADALPPRFVLLAAVIEEPTAKGPGALYVWANALEDGKPAAQPRAYRLAYRKDLHALLDEGLKKARQGVTQLGTAEPRAGRAGLPWLRPGNDDQVLKIRDMPAAQLPEK